MSYSACMYGGLCTGCMRCQDDGYELDNFEQEDDFYAEVREVLEYYNSGFIPTKADLVEKDSRLYPILSLFLAEAEGFEPPWGCPQTVFKTFREIRRYRKINENIRR